MFILLVVLLLITLTTYIILNRPIFGRNPAGGRLVRIKQLSNFKNGAIQNLSPTPVKPDEVSYWQILRGMMKKNVNRIPSFPLPSLKPIFTADLHTKIMWFGHSSYLLQIDGINILVDPVFSATPSPFSFLGYKYFKGTNFIQPEELPKIDVILITHDHYDHLDYKSILKLKQKTKIFITSLGVGAHLEHWKISAE